MLRKLFNPATALMTRLKYPQKFFLITLLLTLPLILVLIFLIAALNDVTDVAQHEIYGNRYLRPLRSLLEHVPQHRSLAQDFLQGNAQAGEPLARKQVQIEEDLARLEAVDRELGQILQTTPGFIAIRSSWQNLKRLV